MSGYNKGIKNFNEANLRVNNLIKIDFLQASRVMFLFIFSSRLSPSIGRIKKILENFDELSINLRNLPERVLGDFHRQWPIFVSVSWTILL